MESKMKFAFAVLSLAVPGFGAESYACTPVGLIDCHKTTVTTGGYTQPTNGTWRKTSCTDGTYCGCPTGYSPDSCLGKRLTDPAAEFTAEEIAATPEFGKVEKKGQPDAPTVL